VISGIYIGLASGFRRTTTPAKKVRCEPPRHDRVARALEPHKVLRIFVGEIDLLEVGFVLHLNSCD
jgi:hypothetical protein